MHRCISIQQINYTSRAQLSIVAPMCHHRYTNMRLIQVDLAKYTLLLVLNGNNILFTIQVYGKYVLHYILK
jgi:hypothetical protein